MLARKVNSNLLHLARSVFHVPSVLFHGKYVGRDRTRVFQVLVHIPYCSSHQDGLSGFDVTDFGGKADGISPPNLAGISLRKQG